MYKSILRPWLFRMDAEKIHGQIVSLLHVYRHFMGHRTKRILRVGRKRHQTY